MKVISLLFVLFSLNAFATVDGHDRVHIVVTNVQDDEDFFMERAPIVGCYGLAQGARLSAWVAEYKAVSNIGCGGPTMYDNINTLTCAKIVDSIESDDFYSFKEITLDISGCAAKDNPRFITMIRTSAKYNFPQKNGSEVKLILKK
jgi:hypothetical protein